MKKTSTIQSLYLILMLDIFAIISNSLFVLIAGDDAIDFVETNLIYNIFIFIVMLFVYMSLAKINSEFKKMSSFKILGSSISFLVFLLNKKYILPIWVFNKYPLTDVLEFVALIIAIPRVYYWYSGFCTLVKKFNQDKLYSDWKNLGIVFMGVTVLTVIGFPISTYGLLLESYMLSFVFSVFLPLIIIIAEVVEFFMILKTVKTIKKIKPKGKTGDG